MAGPIRPSWARRWRRAAGWQGSKSLNAPDRNGVNGAHAAPLAVAAEEPVAVATTTPTAARRRHVWSRRRESRAYAPPPSEALLAPDGHVAVAIARDDDLAAVFGKMDSAGSPRVALVARKGNRALGDKLSMRRFRRHIDATGKDVILVTRKGSLRARALEEGVPVSGSTRAVDFDRPRGFGLSLGWMTLRWPRMASLVALALFLGALALAGAALLWYVPQATVTVFVPAETTEEAVTFTADTKATELNLARAVLPAVRRELTVQRALPGGVTGSVVTPKEHAAVAVRFTNRSAQAVTIPRGTVVTAPAQGVAFTVAQDVPLPPRLGATADAIALSQRPGTVGNIPANAITRIEGIPVDRATATNLTPGEKGTDTVTAIVSDNDIEVGRRVASAYLLDLARADLVASHGGDHLLRDSVRIETLDVTAKTPVGQPAAYSEVNAVAKISALAVAADDLRRLWVDRLTARLAADQMLLDEQATVKVERAPDGELTPDRAAGVVRVAAPVGVRVDRDGLRAALRGKDRAAAERHVRTLVASPQAPTIDLPRWAPWLPRNSERIAIHFKPVATEGA